MKDIGPNVELLDTRQQLLLSQWPIGLLATIYVSLTARRMLVLASDLRKRSRWRAAVRRRRKLVADGLSNTQLKRDYIENLPSAFRSIIEGSGEAPTEILRRKR